MDRWKFFAISHADHVIMNPMSEAKIDDLVTSLDLPAGARVLDVACGKAEVLIRILEHWGATGVGVELSPFEAANARANAVARLPEWRIEIREEDGRDYRGEPGSFDCALGLGMSWVYGGYRETLRALAGFVRPGGLVICGEPFVNNTADTRPFTDPRLAEWATRSHAGNVAIGGEVGLALEYSIVSSLEDWDEYQGLQWRAVERYAAEHPEDPDVPELLALQRAARDRYYAEERERLGWAIYVFLRP